MVDSLILRIKIAAAHPSTFFSVSHGTHAGYYTASKTTSSCGGTTHAFHKHQSPIDAIATSAKHTCTACHTMADQTRNCHQNI